MRGGREELNVELGSADAHWEGRRRVRVLEELASRMTPDTLHPEVDTGPDRGKEELWSERRHDSRVSAARREGSGQEEER